MVGLAKLSHCLSSFITVCKLVLVGLKHTEGIIEPPSHFVSKKKTEIFQMFVGESCCAD